MSQTLQNHGTELTVQDASPEQDLASPVSPGTPQQKNFQLGQLENSQQKSLDSPSIPFTRSMSKLASQLSLKREFAVPKNSTSRTILAATNTLVGSGCLLLPLVMKDSGIITTIVSLTLIGIISAKTCEMTMMHNQEGERDLPEIIVRLLGDKWYYFYSLGAGLLEILIGVAYYLMSCNMFYHIMQFICYYADTTVTSYEVIEFGQFSYQWICVILFVVFFLLSCMDSFKIVIIVNQYGFVCILCFLVFIVYNLFVNIYNDNLSNTKSKPVEINWWTADFSYIFGVLAIMYLIHPNCLKLFSEHAKQEKNIQACRGSFGVAYGIYIFVGVLGYLGIMNIPLPSDVSEANTVLDYFKADDVSNLLISLIFFFDLVSVFPLLYYVGKVLAIQAVWVKYDVKKHKTITRIFDLVFMIINLLLGIFNISPSAVLSIAGAFMGFLIIYIVPIFIHLLCIYQQDFFLVKYSAIYIPPNPFNKIETEFSPTEENHPIQQEICFTQQDQVNKTLEQPQSPLGRHDDLNMSQMNFLKFSCKHDKMISKRLTKNQRYIIYGSCVFVGFSVMINQLYQFISG